MATLENTPKPESDPIQPADPAGFVLAKEVVIIDAEGNHQPNAHTEIQQLSGQYANGDIMQRVEGYVPAKREVKVKNDKGEIVGTKTVDSLAVGPDGLKAVLHVRRNAHKIPSKNKPVTRIMLNSRVLTSEDLTSI